MPVGELLGGALAGAFFQVVFGQLLSPEVWNYFRRRKMDEMLLKRLKMVLRSINAVSDDAEQKQYRDPFVKEWLNEVRDAVLDAEDLLDEIDFEVLKSSLEAESHTSASKVCDSDIDIESRIKQVLECLELLARQKDVPGLKNVATSVRAGLDGQVSHKLPSTSLVAERVIYGRKDDKDMIFNWLTTDNPNQLSVFSIVGMGGVGKTTLAQHVYNDPKIEEAKFDIKAWVCVSDNFDVLSLTKAILGAISKSRDDSVDLEMAHGRLKEKLIGKRFFLVLDDAWDESREKWEALQTPLNYGKQGSKIVVTTRSMRVASTLRSDKIHPLKQLQEEHCWKLLAKHAFNDEFPEVNPEFKEIGMKLANKCKGLPLALKTIGSLLYNKSSILEWENVLTSEIWSLPIAHDNIIPALLLSYHHLPSHLKRCFAFCALFPKDFYFVRQDLSLLWMAENFLECSQHNNNKNMEEIGNEYFDDLLSRSFFHQPSESTKFYVMHDLLNDLAKYVCGNVCFRWESEKEQSITESSRHVSWGTDAGGTFEGFKDLCKANRLRTFLPTSDWYCRSLAFPRNDRIHALFSMFRVIRVLSLRGMYGLVEVPDSLGNLKHLRSLDLSHTGIKKLPDSTCSLFNLQILKLQQCRSLKELPLNFHKLVKLCHFDLRGTQLRELPMHFTKLKNLQVLTGSFCVDKGGKFKIQQLGEANLCGELLISEMQNIVNPSDALAANFKSKMHLRKLELQWSKNHDDSKQEKEVLEKLQPSTRLEQLEIRNYGGTGFPCWFGDDSLSNLVSLELRNCEYCVSLPSLGVLPSLKTLSIIGLRCIVRIGEEFYGSTSPSFKSLEALSFENMEEWQEWNCKDVIAAFPYLRMLSIETCPKLKEQLPKQLPCLKQLTIISCKELVASLSKAPNIQQLVEFEDGSMLIDDNSSSLKTPETESSLTNREVSTLEMIGFPTYVVSLEVLNIGSFSDLNILSLPCCNSLRDLSISFSCDSLITFPMHFFPNLHWLTLEGCRNLQMISQEHSHNHLRHLTITDCPQFESFSGGEGLSAPRLERFRMRKLENLRSLPKQMHTLLPSLTQLSIVDCPQVELISGEGLPSNLTELNLSNCSKLMASLKGALGANISLQSLRISGMGVESFPDEGLLPLSLTSLSIHHFRDLKTLNSRGLSHLSSLTKLYLLDCPNIRCLPEEGLSKSIYVLQICDCPILKQRCQEPNGEDWGKIAHIQNLIMF